MTKRLRPPLRALLLTLPCVAPLLGACATPTVTTERLQREAEEAPAYLIKGTLDDVDDRLPTVGPLVASAKDWKTALQPTATLDTLAVTLSPGDRLQLNVIEGAEFSGLFEVNLDGTLELPHVPPVPVTGLTIAEAEQRVAGALVRAGLFQPHFIAVSVEPVKWAPVWVSVSGAVFKPGRALLNDYNVRNERSTTAIPQTGEFTYRRYLSNALKSAGGVRPDADMSAIKLVRNGQIYSFDMSGIFTGRPFKDIPLIQNDEVIVHSINHYQPELIRVSDVTPPGMQIYSSKLVIPGPSNSNASVGEAITVTYGTRLLRGLIAANCVGGIQSTNSSRYAILVSTNLLTKQAFVIERSIDELIRSADSVLINPYLMPDDGIACYDSRVTNARDAASALLEILAPIGVLRALVL